MGVLKDFLLHVFVHGNSNYQLGYSD